MTEERDDLLIEALERDDDLAWRLAEATARPAPPALRERIVGPHRHRRRARVWTFPRIALAAAAAIVLVVGASLAAGGRVVALDASRDVGGRAALVATPTGGGYLLVALPAPPSGKAYEAWVIRDGQPVPAGLTGGSGVLALSAGVALRAGDVVAITVEGAAGATRPTSDPILVAKL